LSARIVFAGCNLVLISAERAERLHEPSVSASEREIDRTNDPHARCFSVFLCLRARPVQPAHSLFAYKAAARTPALARGNGEGERDREIIAKGAASYLGEIVCFRSAPVAARNVQRVCIMNDASCSTGRKRRCEMRKAFETAKLSRLLFIIVSQKKRRDSDYDAISRDRVAFRSSFR